MHLTLSIRFTNVGFHIVDKSEEGAMNSRQLVAGFAAAACFAVVGQVLSQGPGAYRDVAVNKDGSVTVKNATVPLPGLMSEGSKQVLELAAPLAPDPARSDGEIVFRAGDFTSRLKPADLTAADVRDKAELAALRNARRRDVLLWRVTIGLAASNTWMRSPWAMSAR